MADLEVTFGGVSIPSGTNIQVDLLEDTTGDGTANNTAGFPLVDGQTSYTASGFDGGSGNDVWIDLTLTSVNDDEATPSVTEPITITSANQPPTADLTVTNADDDLDVSADATGSSDPDGDTLTYDYDWGDGNTSNSAGSTATHTYANAGNFTVTVTVTDPSGASDTATDTVTAILNQIQANDGGTIKVPSQIQAKFNGTIQNVSEIYVNDGGTIKKVYDNPNA